MKEATRSMSVRTHKFTYKVNKETEIREREQEVTKIAIPNNVLDEAYFKMAVQYHVYSMGERVLTGKYLVEAQKLKDAGKKATEAQKEKLDRVKEEKSEFVEDMKRYMDILDATYIDVPETIASFMQDDFARLFAVWLMGEKGYVAEDSDIYGEGSTVTIPFAFPEQDKLGGFVLDFKEDITPAQKKITVEAVNAYCNRHLKTWGGDIYKNITYSHSQKLLHDEWFSRSKKDMKIDRKGRGISNVSKDNFELAFQLFAICMYSQGIPFFNGKSQTYMNVGVSERVVARPTTKAEKAQSEQQKPTTENQKPANSKTGNKAK